ncbi:MAG TPA: FAD/NAD(P)-binding oxidoreductase [Dehalococcoidia bacterium]|nr:FAD/NAD(P)-binding oxidoreductase [Dehalococcoidia bacterium]
MADKTVLVLGGGVGGWVAAQRLRRQLDGGHRIVLVDREEKQAFAHSFPWVMMGERRPDEVVRPLPALRRQGIEYHQADVQKIDTAGRKVLTTAGDFAFDYLIIALGAELNPKGIPGLAEAAHTYYDLEGAQRLRVTLRSFREGRIAIAIAGVPYKCPSAPHEGALLLDDHFRRYGLRGQVEIQVFTPEPQPMPSAGPVVGQSVLNMLTQQGITFQPNRKLVAVEGRELVFEDGGPQPFDLLITVPPHRTPACIQESGLANASGYIPVDWKTMATQHEGVYAVGDVTTIPLPGRYQSDRPLNLPKAGAFAHGQGEVVARNIAAEIRGAGRRREFDGMGVCFLATGGGRAGVAAARFYTEPAPVVEMKPPARQWHWGKLLFERYWMAEGPRREALRYLLNLSAKGFSIPASL